MSFELSMRGTITFVDVEFEKSIGIYGREFWSLINEDKYEPETFDFIQRNFRQNSCFLDIGAATGCMSIYAAQLGYKVFSVEPQDKVFEALRRNIALNENIRDEIELVNALVIARESTKISNFFSDGASGPLENLPPSIRTINLVDFFEKKDFFPKIVLKMDIEGAEFNVLRDTRLLNLLKNHSAVLYLSLHPGFLNPLKGNSMMAKAIWRSKAIIEVLELCINLKKYSAILDSSGTLSLNFLSVLFHLKRNSRDFQVNFR